MNRFRGAARVPDTTQPEIGAFRARHLDVGRRRIVSEFGRTSVTVDESESPLAWLARRRGRDGRSLIETHQLQAGERLRTDFTCAHLMPRTTSNLESPVQSGRHAGGRASNFTDTTIAARRRVHAALDAAGPEFAGLLLDICCFLKSLADVERERIWPARSAKVVLQLGLERLARHYGYAGEARGLARRRLRTWLAEDVEFSADISGNADEC